MDGSATFTMVTSTWIMNVATHMAVSVSRRRMTRSADGRVVAGPSPGLAAAPPAWSSLVSSRLLPAGVAAGRARRWLAATILTMWLEIILTTWIEWWRE